LYADKNCGGITVEQLQDLMNGVFGINISLKEVKNEIKDVKVNGKGLIEFGLQLCMNYYFFR
jgi:Ca2+-binding EF-hand superfamily protein